MKYEGCGPFTSLEAPIIYRKGTVIWAVNVFVSDVCHATGFKCWKPTDDGV